MRFLRWFLIDNPNPESWIGWSRIGLRRVYEFMNLCWNDEDHVHMR